MKHTTDNARTIQVLVVARDTATRTFLEQVLTREAYRVLNATSRKETLALLAREEPDVVIVDSHTAAPHGLETLRQLRAVRPEVPVILITHRGSLQTAMEAMRLGAADYLTKPLAPLFLIEAVSNSLREKEALVGSAS